METMIQEDDASLTQQGQEQSERLRKTDRVRSDGGKEREKDDEMKFPMEVDVFVFHQLAHL